MANFLDTQAVPLTKFTPEMDAQTYGQVLAYSRQQYDQGVQRVQTAIDNVAGIEVYRPQDKEYLESKMNELKTKTQQMAGADYSQQVIVSQAAGLTGEIVKDPRIQNAVRGTQQYKADVAKKNEDQKKNGPAPDNDYDFQLGASKWLNGDLDTPYEAGYSPKVDTVAEFFKVFKETHSNTSLTQEAFSMDGNGKITLTTEGLRQAQIEGISPVKVQNAANIAFSQPHVANQIRITGQYNYRGISGQQLQSVIKANYDEEAKNTEKQLADLDLQLATDKTLNGEDIANKKQQLQAEASARLKEYTTLSALPEEALKTKLHETNLKGQLMQTFSWSNQKNTIEANPLFAANMANLKYQLDITKFNYERQKDAEATKQTNAAVFSTPGSVKDVQGELGAATFEAALAQNTKQIEDSQYKWTGLLASGSDSPKPRPYIFSAEQNKYIPNVNSNPLLGYANANAAKIAHDEIYKAAKFSFDQGKATGMVAEMFADIEPLITDNKAYTTIQTRIEGETSTGMAAIRARVGDVDPNLVDYWMVDEKKPGWESAQQRIIGRLGKDGFDQLVSNVEGFTEYDEFGRAYPGSGPTDAGKKNREYKKLANSLNRDPSIVETLTKRENAYKNAQSAYMPQPRYFDTAKPEVHERVTQHFQAILSNFPEGTKDGKNIKSAIDAITRSKTNKLDNILYGQGVDPVTKKPYISITEGGVPIRIEVTPEDLASLPGGGQPIIDPFAQKYGVALSVTQNLSTDVSGEGETSARPVKTPEKSPYTVRYHLEGDGSGTKFAVKAWVRDAQGNMLKGGTYVTIPGAGTMLNPTQVEDFVNKLQNPNYIKEVLKY